MGDPFTFLQERSAALVQSLSWDPADPEWAGNARSILRSVVGVVDEPWIESNPALGPATEETGHTRCAISFPSRYGWNASGWLLIPAETSGPVPAVVCLPGHGAGADAIVGLVDEPYQANFALQCVNRGWVALAVEQVSFGRNRSQREHEKQSSCHMDSLFALQLGETMTGWRVRDAMAAVRASKRLPEVDRDRIAVMGISGGGLTALWTAALDEGVLAAAVSGYFCAASHSILRFDHCPDNYVPGLAKLLDVPDLAGLVAPRWLAVESGREDPIFAIEGFRSACERAESIYGACGCADRFVSNEIEGGHVFDGEVLFRHLEAAFSASLAVS